LFVFALFNLQGTARCLAVSFYMLPHPSIFVKNFFQVFSNFFSAEHSVRRGDSLIMLPQTFQFVKNFFLGSRYFVAACVY